MVGKGGNGRIQAPPSKRANDSRSQFQGLTISSYVLGFTTKAVGILLAIGLAVQVSPFLQKRNNLMESQRQEWKCQTHKRAEESRPHGFPWGSRLSARSSERHPAQGGAAPGKFPLKTRIYQWSWVMITFALSLTLFCENKCFLSVADFLRRQTPTAVKPEPRGNKRFAKNISSANSPSIICGLFNWLWTAVHLWHWIHF